MTVIAATGHGIGTELARGWRGAYSAATERKYRPSQRRGRRGEQSMEFRREKGVISRLRRKRFAGHLISDTGNGLEAHSQPVRSAVSSVA